MGTLMHPNLQDENCGGQGLPFDESCVFCRIVQGKAEASVVFEDEETMAFLDIRPLDVGHTLVIPRTHYIDIFDTPLKQICLVHETSKKIALAVKKATKADGISIIQQNGRAAGQDIFHLHVHVVPRFEGKKMAAFGELKTIEREKLDSIAKEIKRFL